MRQSDKKRKRARRHRRVRSRVRGTKERPRLSVFRSNRHLTLQLIDDRAGRTLVAVSDHEAAKKGGDGKKRSAKHSDAPERRTARAEALGEELASRAVKDGITAAIFDRGGYRYHGIVKAAAEGARKGGLKF